MDKRYIYYVATFNHWVLIPADNAREALEQGEKTHTLNGKPILTVRIASKDDKEKWEFLHQD